MRVHGLSNIVRIHGDVWCDVNISRLDPLGYIFEDTRRCGHLKDTIELAALQNEKSEERSLDLSKR